MKASLYFIAAVVIGLGVAYTQGWAQDAPATQPSGPAASPPVVSPRIITPEPTETPPSAEQVQAQLQDALKPYPQTQPASHSSARPAFSNAPPVTAPMEINRAVIGPAPGEPKPTLMREGQFIVNRRGYIQRTGAGADNVVFVFAADDAASPETPMVLVPCQMLENMENIVYERGERTTFLLSGQVLAYRGANYILPTMMKIALDRGNLQP